ncbi:MAG: hypothetical protein ABI528_05255 [bacterium]
MNPKKFLRSVLLLLVLTLSASGILSPLSSYAANYQDPDPAAYNFSGDDNYSVYIIINGIRWVQVYNDQGVLLDEYPDD